MLDPFHVLVNGMPAYIHDIMKKRLEARFRAFLWRAYRRDGIILTAAIACQQWSPVDRRTRHLTAAAILACVDAVAV